MKNLNSFKSKRVVLDLETIQGGMSVQAAAMHSQRYWISRTNVHHGATTGSPDEDVFGDIALDSN